MSVHSWFLARAAKFTGNGPGHSEERPAELLDEPQIFRAVTRFIVTYGFVWRARVPSGNALLFPKSAVGSWNPSLAN